MSFGDIAPGVPRAHASLLGPAVSPASSPTPAMELQGTLKALSANNAALRRTSQQLRSPNADDHPPLNRVRELREQNRDIARAAANLATRVNDPEARTQFQTLIKQFSEALTESVQAEKEVLRSTTGKPQAPSSAQEGFTESQVAVQQDEQRTLLQGRDATESDPLLPSSLKRVHTPKEEAVLREISANDDLVEERNAVLSQIQSSVEDVNSIFKDLAVMVSDQRTQVDHVEVAVGDSAEYVANARREVLKTQRRRKNRKGLFFCTLLSIAAIIALFLIILLG